MSASKKDMFNRLSQISKSAPLQESAKETVQPKSSEPSPEAVKKTAIVKKAKNLQIPVDLVEAYERIKENQTTSLLMTPYIIEAFRERLARDGAFDKDR